jgi:hypothetical protein
MIEFGQRKKGIVNVYILSNNMIQRRISKSSMQ